jgi:hypothetical protein
MEFPLPRDGYKWQQMQRWAIVCWLIFYCLFLVHVFNQHGGGTWFDAVNMVTHEAGHPLFGTFGNEMLMVWGGTLMQLLVPFLLALSFAWRGQTAGAIFCAFFFFENFIGIALYMGDARDKALPLVSLGVASDEVTGHDWEYIFGHMGLLQHDTQIAAVVRVLGWIGMLSVVCLLVWMLMRKPPIEEEAAAEA